MSTKPRLVSLSPVVPYPGIEHAGGRYLWLLHQELIKSFQVHYIAEELPSTLTAAASAGVADHTLIENPVQGFRRREWRLRRRLAPTTPPQAMWWALHHDASTRQAVRTAEVIDLQWPDYSSLAPLVRQLNPHARIIATLHDVASQRCLRSARNAPDVLRKAKWWLSYLLTRRTEGRIQRVADEVVVFSAKDAALLPNRRKHRACVVPPPLAENITVARRPASPPRVLMVGYYYRDDNRQALRFAHDEIWPLVLEHHPDAVLRVVGTGCDAQFRNSLPRAKFAGFVDDLAAEYAQASVALVPLQHGAGVKFKTVEALLAGVPVVTTDIGAEGVGPAGLFATKANDPAELAAGVVAVLNNPVAASATAKSAQTWARARYSAADFETKIRQIYPSDI